LKSKIIRMDTVTDETYTISLDNEYIYFNHQIKVTYGATNLPKFSFTFHEKPCFWTIAVKFYEASVGALHVQVINYTDPKPMAMYIQDPIYDIKILFFEKLDWRQLEPCLKDYDVDMLRSILLHPPTSIPLFDKTEKRRVLSGNNYSRTQPFDTKTRVLFSETVFMDGKISCKIWAGDEYQTIEIIYPFLQSSFEYCKGWFKKKFKSESIMVHVKGTMVNGKITQYEAYSAELLCINEQMVQEIREIVLKDYLKKRFREDIGNHIKNISDIIEESGLVNLGTKGNSLNENEMNMLLDLVRSRSARNQKQLIYLSTHPNVDMGNFKVTRPPATGLIFAYRGNRFTHYVWELLDSNATYLWSFLSPTNSLEEMHSFLETYISLITEAGRLEWKRQAKDVLLAGHLFNSVNHYGQNSETNEGLPLWIDHIEKLICL
jgi:hypothetical protein